MTTIMMYGFTFLMGWVYEKSNKVVFMLVLICIYLFLAAYLAEYEGVSNWEMFKTGFLPVDWLRMAASCFFFVVGAWACHITSKPLGNKNSK